MYKYFISILFTETMCVLTDSGKNNMYLLTPTKTMGGTFCPRLFLPKYFKITFPFRPRILYSFLRPYFYNTHFGRHFIYIIYLQYLNLIFIIFGNYKYIISIMVNRLDISISVWFAYYFIKIIILY
jgi:hypothetical protein